MFLSKASYLIWHHIMVKVEHRHGRKQAYIVANKSWNNQTNMLLHLTIKGKRQTNKPHPRSPSKQDHIQINACSCECMSYLTYLTASQHLCINGWTCECMIMASKQEIKETLRQHVKGKQVVKQRNKYSKTCKKVKTKAYYIKEKKRQKQETQIRVFGHEYACAYIGLCTQANYMCTHAKKKYTQTHSEEP